MSSSSILALSSCSAFVHVTVIITIIITSESVIAGGTPTDENSEFDFIVVGGGTAGCVLASRLSESGEHTVLLVEAGGLPIPQLDFPATFQTYLSDFLKVYRTVPQKNAGLAKKGVITYPVGRVLGGGSSVNGMAFNRGSPSVYDLWARVTGDSSWNYENMIRQYQKVENYIGNYPSDQHGYNGPITVSTASWTPGLDAWFEGGRYLGYKIAGPSGPQVVSFTPVEFSRENGRRVSSYSAYIRPILQSRPNLGVEIEATVSRVTFEGKRATGVIFSRNGKMGKIFVKANKEVILCAGVIDSPHLLLRSGVGPSDVLDSANIPVVTHLPVGYNLHDRTTCKLDFILKNASAAFIPERDLTPEALRYFNKYGDGPYSNHDGSYGQAFLESSVAKSKNESSWPDMHLYFLQRSIGMTPSNQPIVSCGMLLGRPLSRGRLTLNSTHPDSDPLIDFQYLSHPLDMEVMLEGLKLILKLYEETPLGWKLGASYSTQPLEACNHTKFRSDKYWKCYIMQLSGSPPHGAGSCRMGRGPEDPGAVVDSQLRVIGIQNLRVVDASVMPSVVNANTQAVVYAIAEKGAEMILKSWEESFNRIRLRPMSFGRGVLSNTFDMIKRILNFTL